MDASWPVPVGRSHVEAVPGRFYLELSTEITGEQYDALIAELKERGLFPASSGSDAGEDDADETSKQARPATKSKVGAESGSREQSFPDEPPRAILLASEDRIAADEFRDRLKKIPAGAGVRYLNPVYRLKSETSSARRTYGGQIIVRLKPSELANLRKALDEVSPGADVRELADLLPPIANDRLRTLLDDLAVFKVIELPAMVDALEVAEALNHRLRVRTAAPDWIHMDVRTSARGREIPVGDGWHLDATNVRELWERVDEKALPIVAVIDGGFDFGHPSLGGRLRPDSAFFNSPDLCPTLGNVRVTATAVMHGTKVAAIITGRDAELEPVAPDVNVVGIVVGHYIDGDNDEDGGICYREHEIGLGIFRAITANARIINISLALEFDPLSYFALLYAEENGVLVVASSGNYDRIGGPDGPDIAYPADHPNVMAVGGHDKFDSWATWSNGKRAACWRGGHGVDLCGPAVEIPTLHLNGSQKTSGTSFAAPIVAGIASLLLAEFPFAKPHHLRQALVNSADRPLHNDQDTVRPGRGCVNAVEAHHQLKLIAPTNPEDKPVPQFRNIEWLYFIAGLTLGLVLGGAAIGGWKKGGTPGDPIHPVPTIHGDVMQLSGATCINPQNISTQLTIDLHRPNVAIPVATDTVSGSDNHYEFENVTDGDTYTVSIRGASGTSLVTCPYLTSTEATKSTVTKDLYNPPPRP